MDKREVLRYMRTAGSTDNAAINALADRAIEAVEALAAPKTLYRIFDCTVTEDGVSVAGEVFQSRRLAENLTGCTRLVLFGATAGYAVDREIQRYAKTDTAMAMALSAAGSAKVEEICDALEESIKAAHGVALRPRYSPGYFDLALTAQTQVFRLLELTKRTGITLTDKLLMVPSKSVTAFIGIEEKE